MNTSGQRVQEVYTMTQALQSTIRYTAFCVQKCDVLKGDNDVFDNAQTLCLRKCANSFRSAASKLQEKVDAESRAN